MCWVLVACASNSGPPNVLSFFHCVDSDVGFNSTPKCVRFHNLTAGFLFFVWVRGIVCIKNFIISGVECSALAAPDVRILIIIFFSLVSGQLLGANHNWFLQMDAMNRWRYRNRNWQRAALKQVRRAQKCVKINTAAGRRCLVYALHVVRWLFISTCSIHVAIASQYKQWKLKTLCATHTLFDELLLNSGGSGFSLFFFFVFVFTPFYRRSVSSLLSMNFSILCVLTCSPLSLFTPRKKCA